MEESFKERVSKRKLAAAGTTPNSGNTPLLFGCVFGSHPPTFMSKKKHACLSKINTANIKQGPRGCCSPNTFVECIVQYSFFLRIIDRSQKESTEKLYTTGVALLFCFRHAHNNFRLAEATMWTTMWTVTFIKIVFSSVFSG